MGSSTNKRFSLSRVPRTWFVAAFLILSIAPLASAQDWSQWRGPGRDGLIPASFAPKAWPESLKRVWRVEYQDDDGGCYVTIFSGAAAKQRALDSFEALQLGHLRTIREVPSP